MPWKRWKRRAQRSSGFSLVELMVTVAIIGVLITLAMPNLQRLAMRMRFQSQLNSILYSIRVARAADEDPASLGQLTGNWCTACSCSGDCRAKGFKTSACSSCRDASDATWRKLGLERTPISPFGTPWLMDENENEHPGCEGRDLLTVARDDNQVDYKLVIPRAVCPDTLSLSLTRITTKLAERDGNQALNDWPLPP